MKTEDEQVMSTEYLLYEYEYMYIITLVNNVLFLNAMSERVRSYAMQPSQNATIPCNQPRNKPNNYAANAFLLNSPKYSTRLLQQDFNLSWSQFHPSLTLTSTLACPAQKVAKCPSTHNKHPKVVLLLSSTLFALHASGQSLKFLFLLISSSH